MNFHSMESGPFANGEPFVTNIGAIFLISSVTLRGLQNQVENGKKMQKEIQNSVRTAVVRSAA